MQVKRRLIARNWWYILDERTKAWSFRGNKNLHIGKEIKISRDTSFQVDNLMESSEVCDKVGDIVVMLDVEGNSETF